MISRWKIERTWITNLVDDPCIIVLELPQTHHHLDESACGER
jgi:hypothetical protein